ncbi:hypothetical protein [Sphingomonas sp. ABOLH]|nr:hypothetical protein [Sphingomonas sp. ABOLH]
MLNPTRVRNGKLDSRFFSSWKPGATTFRSFWDMMAREVAVAKSGDAG